jgi:anti-sigma B factor antagonist
MSEQLETFEVEVRAGTRGVTLRVSGDLDLATSPLLDEHLRTVTDTAAGDVDIDLAGVDFLDSAALRVLVMSQRRLQAARRRLTVSNPSTFTRRVFDMTALAERFEIDAASGEAVAG